MRKSFVLLSLGVGLLSATCMTAPANATDIPIAFDGSYGGWDQLITAAGTYRFTFTVPGSGTASASATNASVHASNLNVTSLKFDGLIDFTQTGFGSTKSWEANDLSIVGGAHFIEAVIGNPTPSGHLAGTVAFDAGPVPEPASWALMLGGFGLVGGTLRAASRRGKTEVSFNI